MSQIDCTLLLTEEEAAKILNTSRRTLQGWRMRSVGPRYKKLGKVVRYAMVDLQNFIEASTVVPSDDFEEKKCAAYDRALIRKAAGQIKRGRPRKAIYSSFSASQA